MGEGLNHQEKFKTLMHKMGFNFEGSVEATGKIERFGPKKSCWYFFSLDGSAAWGCFGDWRTGEKHYYRTPLLRAISAEKNEQISKQIEQMKERFDAEKKRAQEEARIIAQRKWDEALAEGKTAYTERKQINELYGTRITDGDVLLVPMQDEHGIIQGLQSIYPDGSKYFLSGQRVGGMFHIINPVAYPSEVYLCEGFATGATVAFATGGVVVVAFNASNLVKVAEALMRKWPDIKVIVASDNDWERETNVGLSYGNKAAKACGGKLIYPAFKVGENHEGMSDFNDVHLKFGIEAVRAVLAVVPNVPEKPKEVSLFKEEIITEESTKQSKIAEALLDASRGKLFFDPTYHQWWTFSDRWRAEDESDLKKRILEVLSRAIPAGFSDSFVNGVNNLMRVLADRPPKRMGRNYLPFENGYIDLKTKEFHQHSINAFFEWCLPYKKSDDYKTPVIDRVLWNVAGRGEHDSESKIQVLKAFMGACLYGMYEVEKYLELIGEAGGGKSTVTDIAQLVVGIENVATSSLDRLDTNRFETAGFYRKRLITFPDQDDYGGTGSMLKRATGGDLIPFEIKGLKVTSPGFVYEGLIIVTANSPIRFADSSTAMLRRRIPVIVNAKVPVGERDPDIKSKIKEEIPNFINQLIRLSREEIIWSLSQENNLYKADSSSILTATNDIAYWLSSEEVEVDLQNEVRSKDLYQSYKEFCEQVNKRPSSSQKFFNHLRSVAKEMGIVVEVVKKNNIRHSRGLKIRGQFDTAYSSRLR